MEIGPKQLADRKPLSLRRVQRLFLTNSTPWWGTVCWSLLCNALEVKTIATISVWVRVMLRYSQWSVVLFSISEGHYLDMSLCSQTIHFVAKNMARIVLV